MLVILSDNQMPFKKLGFNVTTIYKCCRDDEECRDFPIFPIIVEQMKWPGVVLSSNSMSKKKIDLNDLSVIDIRSLKLFTQKLK